MYYNSTILTNLHNFRDYAVSGINYSVSGIAAHFAGLAVEVVSIYYLQRIQYLRYMKIPIAKALHEMTESFFSSSATINLKNDNGLFDTLKKITEPMWNYPGETVTAVMFSYLFEKFGIKYLDLTECVHNNYETDMSQPFGFVPGHSQNINSHGYVSALQHNHCNWDWSHITNEIYKGILSIAGSYSGALVYNDSQFYLNKYYSSENQPNVGKVKTEPNMNKIIEEVNALTGGAETEIATVKIEGQTYTIFCKLGSNADPAINDSSKKITIEKADFSSINAAELQTLVDDIKIGGTKSAPTIDASGTALDCSSINFNTETSPQSCAEITGLPGDGKLEEVKKVLDSIGESETVNTANVEALKKLNDNQLKEVSTETIDAITRTVAESPVDMTGKLDKVIESYAKVETATELNSDNVAESVECILYGECN